ncbi:putative benzoate 4-monooxygenase cytochrome protein [Neofusicoccum parvum UCRNP2]|uniref:Putative benzoate 4-monooxygenase cytochrome protein n=1 Tax=Botryosphaeria parva (strain UCR-NP2) TaxID=1287680 RepID=R1EV20_BOTPV|nr:putative benzoate 4-monooxygenase cytochrome protein [Neofusicoccum parvum UCRNP2]
MPNDINSFAPLALGVLVHLCYRVTGIELDAKVWRVLGLYSSGLVALGFYSLFVSRLDFAASAWRTCVAAALFNAGLYASIGAGRLLRLRGIPGPFLARLSQFYALGLTAKNNQFHIEVDKLHRQYGDFVRIGPRHISINRASAIPLVYGPPSRCPKALSSYEDRVKAKTERLVEQLRDRANEPVNVTAWTNAFSLDVIGDVGLGTEFRSLDHGKDHPAIKGVHESMAIIGFLSAVPWLLKLLSETPGASGGFKLFKQYCGNQVVLKEKALDRDKEPQDLLSWLLKARYENDRSAPPGKVALDEDARLIIIAGSDTTAAALANTIYYLAKDRRVLEKLRSILDTTFPNGLASWTYAEVKNIAYLDYIINEVLRLRPPVPSGLSRTTPPEGLQIDDVFIPGDTVVMISAHTIQRDPRYFENPDEFCPERWSTLSTETSPFLAFSRGKIKFLRQGHSNTEAYRLFSASI